MEFDRNGLQVLDREECFRRLRCSTIGRVGVSFGALPVVLPVNFLLDRDVILIRTSAGTKLEAALRNAVVCLEVDDFDSLDHSGWSVLVTGRSHVVEDPEELARVDGLPLARWVPANGRVVAISTELVTGREVTRSAQLPPTPDRS